MHLGAFGGENMSGFIHGLLSLISVVQYTALAGCVLYMQNYTMQQERKTQRFNQKLHHMAIRDGMTGLFNHSFMQQFIQDAINRSRRSRNPLSLLMIDIDFFKQINDSFGHNAGDEALKELISVLNANKRSTDYLGRWGGDELIMLLTDTNLAGAIITAEKLRNMVADHPFTRCKQLTISVGASLFQDGDTPVTFVERADAAMYRAKRGGRNRVEGERAVVNVN
jgi:polar amino acid transport system substrate-binding protein